MKPDLIERLREHVRYQYMPAEARVAMEEASKEIERLREALTAIDNVPGSNFTTINAMRALALAALQPILPSGGDAHDSRA